MSIAATAREETTWRRLMLAPSVLLLVLFSILPVSISFALTLDIAWKEGRAAVSAAGLTPLHRAPRQAVPRRPRQHAGFRRFRRRRAIDSRLRAGVVDEPRAPRCNSLPNHLHPADPDPRHHPDRRDLATDVQYRFRPHQSGLRPPRARAFRLAESADTALMSVIIVDIWHWTPFCFLLFLAGLESLPQDVSRRPIEWRELAAGTPLRRPADDGADHTRHHRPSA